MAELQERVGVLLVNTGTPDAPTAEAVKRYLKEFLSHPRIVPLPGFIWQPILNLFVLPRRSEASAAKYRKIWTKQGSPLAVYMASLAQQLNAYYETEERPISVKWAMSFGNPTIPEVLEQFRAEGISRLIVLPLYPQTAFSTTKVVEDQVKAQVRKMSWRPFIRYVNGYAELGAYARAIAASLLDAGFKADSTDEVVFSFHSIPLADIEAGDSYERQCGASCLAIMGALDAPRGQWSIGYQCRFDKNRDWLGPETVKILQRESEGAPHRVFIVCPGFSVDCLETIYDVQMQLKTKYQNMLLKQGNKSFEAGLTYAPCLNDSQRHVDVLIEVIRRAVQ